MKVGRLIEILQKASGEDEVYFLDDETSNVLTVQTVDIEYPFAEEQAQSVNIRLSSESI